MGALRFLTVGRGNTAEQAFWREVMAAIAAHGNDGYTGTVAEKWEFVVLEGSRKARSIDLARWALDFSWLDPIEDMPSDLRPLVQSISEQIEDKWGPAAVMALPPEECAGHAPLKGEKLFLVFGWASW